MEVDTKINKVFECIVCESQFCRICKRDWDDHFGISCEEMDERDKRGQFINQVFECLVCYEEVELNRVVFCNIHVSATGKNLWRILDTERK
ncbi:unnamed protein product [Meloidogyne enterolobii]|uniref:Uncharacterized protein n=1 Tax=Meloidogyne enterolobii TaxID=390850 RepID=A0ACB0XLW5_MELEN